MGGAWRGFRITIRKSFFVTVSGSSVQLICPVLNKELCPMTSPSTKRVLFAFDFDDTLVEGWSDLWALDVAPALKLNEKVPSLMNECGDWLRMMNHTMHLIHESGYGKEQIIGHMKKLKLQEGMSRFLKKTKNYPDIEVVIISDGNTEFIAAALDGADCSETVREIYANPASFSNNGRLTIKGYNSRLCQRCQGNNTAISCKGAMMSEIMSNAKYDKIVYVGDSGNDVCPCLKLTENDCIIARKGHPLAKTLLNQLDAVDQPQYAARLFVHDFNAAAEIESVLTDMLPQV